MAHSFTDVGLAGRNENTLQKEYMGVIEAVSIAVAVTTATIALCIVVRATAVPVAIVRDDIAPAPQAVTKGDAVTRPSTITVAGTVAITVAKAIAFE